MIAAHRAETPEREAESAVRVEAEGDVPAGVQLALQLHGAAQRGRGGVGHLDTSLGGRNNVEMKNTVLIRKSSGSKIETSIYFFPNVSFPILLLADKSRAK